MCGIAGFWQPQPETRDRLMAMALSMAQTLRHRGPDDEGTWVAPEAGLGFSHRRLAILDLSTTGHQPMLSACGRYVILFNGEIYNFLSFKQELLAMGHRFRGSSDTEVLVEAIACWGIDNVAHRLNGIFAFAVWDRMEQTLTLVRDHMGVKPLYYGWVGDAFIFGSELKALAAYPEFRREIDPSAVGLLLRYNYIPAPYCIWKCCHKLPAGHKLVLKRPGERPKAEPFWSLDRVVNSEDSARGDRNAEDAVAELDGLLRDSVRLQMVADVPLGAFLSGGIDSSTVVALMQSQSTKKVKTFTVALRENKFNEGAHARNVAGYLGTDHTELLATPEDALAVTSRLSTVFDEPFADSSQIPTFLVAQLTRRHVTVSLSGDGGDELFAGYSHYRKAGRIWRLTRTIPRSLRSLVAKPLYSLGGRAGGTLVEGCKRFLSRTCFDTGDSQRLLRAAATLMARDATTYYNGAVSRWLNTEEIVPRSERRSLPFAEPTRQPCRWDVVDVMAYFDLLNYLPEDVLTKVDRASMAVSLEARVPLLDYRLVEFSARLPVSLKIKHGRGKWLLRQVLHRYVPQELVDRPKMGFRIPLAVWLRGPLREWAEELLRPKQLESEGLLSSEPIRKRWAEHQGERHDWSRHLWSVLMFQSWKQNWI